MNRTIAMAATALLMTLAGCGKEKELAPPSTDDLTGTNKWIREQLEEWYYWRDPLVASSAPGNSLSYDEFLRQSLIGLTAAKDADGTMDGGYGVDGERYLYSRISRITGGTRASTSRKVTYGFSVIAIGYGDTSPRRYGLLVTWVLPDGPADKAGLKRGMILNKYNGEWIYQYRDFSDQLFSQSSRTMSLTAENGDEFSFAGESTRIDPILKHDVIASPGGKKVAYLMYNAFEQGDLDPNGELGEFDHELDDVFASFKDGDAAELVVDLRYNGGGAVYSANLLSSLAGNVDDSQVFAKLKYNDHIPGANPRNEWFTSEENSMNLDKVYALVSGDTASASEMFINSLRGVDIEVVLIGQRTEGKNVGMNLRERTDGIYRYEMWPISFKISNAKGFDDYSDGFAPDVELDELAALFLHQRGEIYDFGDERETLLNAALTLIDGGTVPPSGETRAAGGVEVVSLRDPSAGGARIYKSRDEE